MCSSCLSASLDLSSFLGKGRESSSNSGSPWETSETLQRSLHWETKPRPRVGPLPPTPDPVQTLQLHLGGPSHPLPVSPTPCCDPASLLCGFRDLCGPYPLPPAREEPA